MKSLISIVIPCRNEAGNLPRLLSSLRAELDASTTSDFEFVFVDDGSIDDTLEILLHERGSDDRISIIELSRNFGKEAALTAGLEEAIGDAVIPLDADLQDPVALIHPMIALWRDGNDVVLAKRSDRATDSLAKRLGASLFYWLHNRIADDVQIPENVGDFRLLDRRVVDSLAALPENRRFMKGLFAWVGFKTAIVEYSRPQRIEGESRFHTAGLFRLALEGITSFSTAPLRVWVYFGSGVALLAIAYATFIIVRTLLRGIDVPGYASLLVAVLFLGGVQLIGIGVLGEYIGRIYAEAKRRPAYIVRSRHSSHPTRGLP